MASAGLAIPLALVFTLLTTLGLLLLSPKPLCTPAVALARGTKNQTGNIVLITISVVLVLLLASPAYEFVRLSRTDHHDDKDRNEQEARTMLAAFLIIGDLLLIFVLRKLGNAIGDMDRMKLSEGALLRQVKGLQQEYTRLMGDSGPAKGSAAADSQMAGLKAEIQALKQEAAELQDAAQRADKARRAAESNAAALKSQARGLENEYDRLLAEHDKLQRRLTAADPGYGSGGKKDS